MNIRHIGLLLCIVAASVGCRQKPTPIDSDEPRIVSLAPSLTEMMAAIDSCEHLVGRTSACNYPSDVNRVPVVGGFGVPSMESLMGTAPTLVLTTALADEGFRQQLEDLGIRHERITCERLGDIAPALRRIGELTGKQDRAEALATSIETSLQAIRGSTIPHGPRPTVYLEIWNDPLMTAGKATYLNQLIELAGGSNIAATVDKAYFKVSAEWVVKQNPDIIICTYMGKQDLTKQLRSRPGWQHVTAVEQNHIHSGLDDDVILRPGPRVIEAIRIIRTCITISTEHP